MNKERREELLEVCNEIEDIINHIDDIRCEEEDAFESLPEGLQESVRGQDMQDAMDTLDGFKDDLYDIQGKIEAFAKPKKKKKP